MQPREKLDTYGVEHLESRELVAVLLWSWVQWADVFTLSKKVQNILKEKWPDISREDLMSLRGIWNIKSMQMISAFELAKRYFVQDLPRIESTKDVIEQAHEYRHKKQEYLICLSLDWANRLIKKRVVTIWLLNQSLIHPREVFADPLQDRANSIVLIHNHPSNTREPSQQDKVVTRKIQEAGHILGIKLIDHVIVTKSEYWSFKEEWML